MAKITGRESLLAKMAKMPPAVRSAVKQALAQGADEVQSDMKRHAPKKSGALRDSIAQTWGGGKVRYSSLSGNSGEAGDPDLTVRISVGNAKVRYSHIVEFGSAPHINGGLFAGTEHPGTQAQPFFFVSYRANRSRVRSRMTRAASRALKQIAGG